MSKNGKFSIKKKELEWRHDILRKWHRAFNTLIEMFHDRGYDVQPDQLKSFDIKLFKQVVLHKWVPNTGFVFKIPAPKNKKAVKIHGKKSVKVCFYRSKSIGTAELDALSKKLTPCPKMVIVIKLRPNHRF